MEAISISDKTLYVSDLDGTLLRGNETTSAYTDSVINSLVEQGMHFSYATARSFATASKVAKGIRAKVPLIVYNGALIIDNHTQEIILSHFFDAHEVAEIREALQKSQIEPIVYSFINGVEKFSYLPNTASQEMQVFLDSRKGDFRDHPLMDAAELFAGKVFYFACIDAAEKLFPVYQCLQSTHHCIYQKEFYSGNQWLEILPLQASKANAILQLKKHLNCNRVIAFGDGKNDISMFQISDECYAVENAVDELKEIATGIIPSNDQDGVAKWLEAHTGR